MMLGGEKVRNALVVQMQAYACGNVRSTAEEHAQVALRGFDADVKAHPSYPPAFWAGFYYTEFKNACQG